MGMYLCLVHMQGLTNSVDASKEKWITYYTYQSPLPSQGSFAISNVALLAKDAL